MSTVNVTSIDLDEETCAEARTSLAAAGVDQMQVISGGGARGNQQGAAYDRIIVTMGRACELFSA